MQLNCGDNKKKSISLLLLLSIAAAFVQEIKEGHSCSTDKFYAKIVVKLVRALIPRVFLVLGKTND